MACAVNERRPSVAPARHLKSHESGSSMICEVEGQSRHMLIARNLEAAFQHHPEQFHLAMQPIVEAASGAVLRWQTLLYWSHPQLGNVPPGEFIPIAEKMGLAEVVGDRLLEATLQHLIERAEPLSVKVSRLTLARKGFAG
jgi:EAL domain-containing protein (putative c-di-GMP-specific phosphodiesterase class I)